MPLHLKRYQSDGDTHFITFSCHNRLAYLNTPAARNLFCKSLETTRNNYDFDLIAYVVMPNHIHLLLTEPTIEPLSKAIQALKVSVSKQSRQTPFWLPRYHDRNITDHNTCIDILRYIHHNPVKRGLVTHPQDWQWSTFRHYYLNEPSPLKITPPNFKG